MLNVIFWDFWYIVYEIMNMVLVNNNVWKYVCIKVLKKNVILLRMNYKWYCVMIRFLLDLKIWELKYMKINNLFLIDI